MSNIQNLIELLKEISLHKNKLKELEEKKKNIIFKIFNSNEKDLGSINIFDLENNDIFTKNDIHVENQIDESDFEDDTEKD